MVYRLLLINHARIRFAARLWQRFSVLSFTPPAVREHGRWLDCVKKWVKKKKPRQSAVYVSHYVSITRLWGGVLILFLMLKLFFFITRWNCFRAKTPPASLLCANVSTSPNLENFFFLFQTLFHLRARGKLVIRIIPIWPFCVFTWESVGSHFSSHCFPTFQSLMFSWLSRQNNKNSFFFVSLSTRQTLSIITKYYDCDAQSGDRFSGSPGPGGLFSGVKGVKLDILARCCWCCCCCCCSLARKK